MKILLFGKNGQVGWELQRSLAPLGDLISLDRHDQDLCGDLLDLEGLKNTVRQVRPDVIVNAAAYTAVDKAEGDAATALAVNAKAPSALAEAAQVIGAWLVHYSTDYVFDGSGSTPWAEDDVTGPLSIYGQTKLEGEQGIQTLCQKHLILRTSWVYASRGGNFAKTMLRLAAERDSLTVINDQFGAPTGADMLADITAHMVRGVQSAGTPDLAGTYHAAAAGETSWHGYASFVLEQARGAGAQLKTSAASVMPVPTTAFPTPARRPHNSRLKTDKLKQSFGLQFPSWQSGVKRMLAEII